MKLPKIRLKKVNHNGNEVFMLDWGRGKKRKRKFFQTKIEAENYRSFIKTQFAKEGTDWMRLTPELRAEAIAASKMLDGTDGTLLDAVRHYLKYIPSSRDIRLEDAYTRFIKVKEQAGCRPDYIVFLKSVLVVFIRDHPGVLLNQVSAKIIEDWFRTKFFKPITCKNYTGAFSSFFSFCIKQKLSALNPTHQLELPKVVERPVEVLTIKQCQKLMETAQETEQKLKLTIPTAICLFAGLRPSEVIENAFSILDKYIEVIASKVRSRRRRLVTIQPNLKSWLDRYCKKKIILISPDTEKKWTVLRRKAGIIPWPHDAMRHSFASYHLAKFKDAAKTALELGHFDQDMLFGHYREVVTQEEAEQFFKIFPK